jgi:hypothetical protein
VKELRVGSSRAEKLQEVVPSLRKLDVLGLNFH